MITISTNVAVGAGSIVMCAGFLFGYAIGWRQLRSRPRLTFDPVRNVLACDMPLTPEEMDLLRDEVAMWIVKPARVGNYVPLTAPMPSTVPPPKPRK